MSAVLHVSPTAIATQALPKEHRPILIASAIAATAAGGAALALLLYAGPSTHASALQQAPGSLPVLGTEAPPAFASEVDWSRIEPSPDPGPMAVAAYGP